jgi:aspartyl protease family protein
LYPVQGSVNGLTANFIVDTGATNTTLSAELASRLGIHSCVANSVVSTANGIANHCRVIVSSLIFAGFNFRDILVSVSPIMQGPSLIGNDILSIFKIEQEQGLMVLSR